MLLNSSLKIYTLDTSILSKIRENLHYRKCKTASFSEILQLPKVLWKICIILLKAIGCNVEYRGTNSVLSLLLTLYTYLNSLLSIRYSITAKVFYYQILKLSWRRSLSYRNQSTDFQSTSMDWFLYDRDLCYERINKFKCSVEMYIRS